MLKALDWPPVWTLGHMALAALIAAVWSIDIPEMRLTGWIIILAAVVLAGAAVVKLRRAGTSVIPGQDPTALVTTGPYGFSRNPIYVADVLALFGWCLAVGQPLAAALCYPLFRALDARFAKPEEDRLLQVYGQKFVDYANEVRRWI